MKRTDIKTSEQNKIPFAKKHPRLNMLLGLLLLLIIAGIFLGTIFLVFKLLGVGITKAIDLIASISSTLDGVIVVALITGAVSIIGVIISSVVAKVIEHKHKRMEYLTQKREQSYGEFVEMVYKIQRNGKNGYVYTQEEMFSDVSSFSRQITLWGSSTVVNKWVEFRENSLSPQEGAKNLFILEEIMNAMRKDLGLKKVKKGNLLAFFVNDIKNFVNGK